MDIGKKVYMDAKELGKLVKKVVISVEHGWLCFRNADQWLLLTLKTDDPRVMKGLKLEDVADELKAGFETVRLEKAASRE